MTTYLIKLSKTIEVEVEADTIEDALHQAREDNGDYRWDAMWSWATVDIECSEQEISGVGKTYKIIRHYKDKPSHIVHTGFTLEQAQEWCRRDDTHGDGWFDGYTEE
jgi:hypothetical protein